MCSGIVPQDLLRASVTAAFVVGSNAAHISGVLNGIISIVNLGVIFLNLLCVFLNKLHHSLTISVMSYSLIFPFPYPFALSPYVPAGDGMDLDDAMPSALSPVSLRLVRQRSSHPMLVDQLPKIMREVCEALSGD